MKRTACIEFYKYKHCKKVISSISITFETRKELIKKCKQIEKECNLRLLFKDNPLSPFKNAFIDLPLE